MEQISQPSGAHSETTMNTTEESFEMGRPDEPAHTGGPQPLSVALLFYIVTVSAIATACLRTLADNEFATWAATTQTSIAASGLGLVSGAVAGFVYRTRGLDFFLLPVVGCVIGAFSGLLLMVDEKYFTEVVLLAFSGCWVLIIGMLLVARFQS